jgi:GH15 family glucan-1,4-alpha-glucosidase
VDRVREPIEAATRYTLERTLNPYLYLVETTSSLHESSVSEGYDLWNNCVHAAAFALCHRLYGGERFRRLGLLIRRSIGLFMTQDGRFLRRLDRGGYPDPRPDVQIMAPYYFGLWAPNERSVMNSAEMIERALWNVEIGGYTRFLPYSAAERVRLPGPWPLYSAWMAQFHFDAGNKDRAETILHWLFSTMRNGEIPESLVPAAVVQRFGRERRRALGTAPALDSAPLAAERARLIAELDEAERGAEDSASVALGGPLVWAHLETLRALKKGGHVDRWETDPAAQSPAPDLTGM